MGRAFCKRLYRATCGFVDNFNCRSIWQEQFISSDAINLFTDAAGSVGFGAFFNGHWSAEVWPDLWCQSGLTRNILLLELFPVLVAITIWGEFFRNKRIMLHSDNKGVVFAINCLSAKSPPVISILRKLVLHCLEINLWLKALFIPGSSNLLADALSCQQWDNFKRLAPEADPSPTPCPLHLWDILLV